MSRHDHYHQAAELLEYAEAQMTGSPPAQLTAALVHATLALVDRLDVMIALGMGEE